MFCCDPHKPINMRGSNKHNYKPYTQKTVDLQSPSSLDSLPPFHSHPLLAIYLNQPVPFPQLQTSIPPASPPPLPPGGRVHFAGEGRGRAGWGGSLAL